MKLPSRACLAAVLSLWTPCALTQSGVPAMGREISGVVVNGKGGEPIPDVQLTLTRARDRQQVGQVLSDAEGRFAFDNLGSDKFDLVASRRGYVQSAYQQHEGDISTAIVTGEDQITSGLRLELTQEASISGVVQEDSGDPVPHARVSLFRKDPFRGTGDMVRVASTGTDQMGNFQFSALMPGIYFACAVGRPWYAQGAAMMFHLQTSANREHWRALDVAYAPTCYPESTDPNAADPIQLSSGDRGSLKITMHAEPAVHLMVRIPQNNPGHGVDIPQVFTRLFGDKENIDAGARFQSHTESERADGVMTEEITGVAGGEYDLQLRDSQSGSTRQMAVTADSNHTDVDMSAARIAPEVSGQVISGNGVALSGHRLVVLNRGGEINAASLQPDGSFKIPSLASGEYQIAVISSNGSRMAIVGMKATGATLNGHVLKIANDPVRLNIIADEANATVNGVAHRFGKPASGVFILLAPTDARTSSERMQPNQSDSDGTFNFYGVAPGEYAVIAIEEGWKLDWARPEVLAPYLLHAQKVTVTPQTRQVNLSKPIDAQPLRQPAS